MSGFGAVSGALPGFGLPGAPLAVALGAMAASRAVDEALHKLDAQGELGAYAPPPRGEVARALVAASLGRSDWLVTDGAGFAAALARGARPADLVHHARGDEKDPSRGHPLPGHFSLRAAHLVAAGRNNGAHLTHAAGIAWAAKMKREPVAVVALFDASQIDTAEFHHGVNFAGVFGAPVIFVALARAAFDVRDRAIAYGIASATCDADDPASILAAMDAASAHARSGAGATLVEARLGPETDDARALEALSAAAARALGGDAASQGERSARVDATTQIGAALEAAPPTRATLVEGVYADVPRHLREQLAARGLGE